MTQRKDRTLLDKHNLDNTVHPISWLPPLLEKGLDEGKFPFKGSQPFAKMHVDRGCAEAMVGLAAAGETRKGS